MNLKRGNELRAHAVAVWQRTREQFVRLPATARVTLSLFLFAALLMALYTTFSGKDASLQLKVQHSLRGGQLSVWLDGDLAYSGSLVGNSKRKFGVIPSVQGSLSETLPVAPGMHQIKVQVVSDSGMRESTISGEFARHGQRTLSASVGRGDLSLNWRSETAGSEPTSNSQGWLTRYAGTLMMTVAGSIISALTGFALRELPKQMASRAKDAAGKLDSQPSSN
jgi:hypothetical protein